MYTKILAQGAKFGFGARGLNNNTLNLVKHCTFSGNQGESNIEPQY